MLVSITIKSTHSYNKVIQSLLRTEQTTFGRDNLKRLIKMTTKNDCKFEMFYINL